MNKETVSIHHTEGKCLIKSPKMHPLQQLLEDLNRNETPIEGTFRDQERFP